MINFMPFFELFQYQNRIFTAKIMQAKCRAKLFLAILKPCLSGTKITEKEKVVPYYR